MLVPDNYPSEAQTQRQVFERTCELWKGRGEYRRKHGKNELDTCSAQEHPIGLVQRNFVGGVVQL